VHIFGEQREVLVGGEAQGRHVHQPGDVDVVIVGVADVVAHRQRPDAELGGRERVAVVTRSTFGPGGVALLG
jgi:hypothetical protein